MLLDGQPYRPHDPRAAIRSGVATIYQELNLLSLRSVVANITLGKEQAQAGVLDRARARGQAAQALALLGAVHIPLDAPVGQLKVGEKQIVEIAKALLDESRLLIMDEPTSALNSTEVGALFSYRAYAEGTRRHDPLRISPAGRDLRVGGFRHGPARRPAHPHLADFHSHGRHAHHRHDRPQVGGSVSAAQPEVGRCRVGGPALGRCAGVRRRVVRAAGGRGAGAHGAVRRGQDRAGEGAVRRLAARRR